MVQLLRLARRQVTRRARPGPFAVTADRIGRFIFRYRDYIVPLGFVVAVSAIRLPHAPAAWPDTAAEILGLAVAGIGQAWRIAVIGFAYIQRGGAQKQLSAPTLVREGIYAHCRNPMYLGDFLLVVGLALVCNAPAVYMLIVPAHALALLAMVRAEERFLAHRFGAEYDAYRQQVNRFIPRVSGIRATLAPLRFDWRRALRKEYGTTFAWVSAAWALIAWKRALFLGWPAAEPALRTLAWSYAPVPVLYVLVRWMKKSGRLRDRSAHADRDAARRNTVA